ncbi:MAG: SpoIIIAH-like family protein [Cellulosilyticum sp.]|nr:SpoIIIAH-like family protein [Cellulosilyticum sp.]
MFNLKRNQIIITVLVFMIAIAAYLNTQETPDSFQANYVAENEITQPEEVDFFAGYDEQVAAVDGNVETPDMEDYTVEGDTSLEELSLNEANNTESMTATITKKTEEAFGNVEVEASKNLEDNYFAEEKLLREQSRAQQVEQLTEYVANENLDQDAKSKAAANLIEIQERIEKENSAEALLKAKGFSEVYVRIDDDTVDVVVNKAELTETEIAQIEEIVNRKTGYSVGKINITPLNGVANN